MSEGQIPPKPHADSSFKQQKLQSYFPQFAALTMSLLLLGVAVVFIPIGAAIVVSSDAIQEIDVRYDQINKCTSSSSGSYTFTFNGTTISHGCNSKVVVTLSKTMSAPVYLYYRLKNFHQNYRQYQISHDDTQLSGGTDYPIDDCKPFRYPGEINGVSRNADGIAYTSYFYNPCGTVAWSMFNDSISLYKVTSSAAIDTTSVNLPTNVDVVCVGKDFSASGVSTNAANLCSKTGIALSADVDTRYTAPSQTALTWSNSGKSGSDDPFLAGGYYAFEAGHKLPVPTDEDFMVWARTASMPDFWKLYRVINVDLVAGDYLFDIEEYFDVTSFEGEKHVVLATRAWIGGKNYALGIILIVVGCFSFVLAVAALVVKLTSGNNTA